MGWHPGEMYLHGQVLILVHGGCLLVVKKQQKLKSYLNLSLPLNTTKPKDGEAEAGRDLQLLCVQNFGEDLTQGHLLCEVFQLLPSLRKLWSLVLFKHTLILSCMWLLKCIFKHSLFICVSACMHHAIVVKVERCESQESNSGHQAWRQTALPTKPSLWLLSSL